MINNRPPVISCICVTRKKPALLERAVRCFLIQSYQQKELVIVYEDDDQVTIDHIGNMELAARKEVVLVCVRSYPKVSLGELRNTGIKAARGEFICQWDDDDWYHIDRLVDQYNALTSSGRDGSILTQWLVFDSIRNKAYISNKRLWEGSVLCRKSVILSAPYEDKAIGEDTMTIDRLVSMDALHFMDDTPALYIYIYHGRNTWNFEHWNEIFECSMELSPKDSMDVADVLYGKYSLYKGTRLLDMVIAKNLLHV